MLCKRIPCGAKQHKIERLFTKYDFLFDVDVVTSQRKTFRCHLANMEIGESIPYGAIIGLCAW